MNENVKNLSKYFIIILASFCILFLFSTSTSTLYGNYYEDDSAIFIVMGKAITQGLIPYKDIFDHKGPILFFIQVLGQIISEGRNGIFLIQVISLSITNILFYKIMKNFCNGKNVFFSFLVSMSVFCLFMEEGNLTEELSLPFLTLCLYLGIKWIKSTDLFDENIYKYAMIYGVCFAIIAFIRLNNAAIICGLLLGIIIIFIKNTKYKELFKSSIFFLIGILIIYLPLFLYFYKNNALSEMLYGTFFFNFEYINVDLNPEYDFMQKIRCSIHILVLFLITFPIMKNNKNLKILMTTTSIITFLVLFIGEGFSHYYVISVPIVAVYVSYILGYFENIYTKLEYNIIYIILVVVCVMYMCIRLINTTFYLMNVENVSIQNVESMIEKIHEEEKCSILVYNHHLAAPIYLYGDFMPNFKYAFHQNNLMKVKPSIKEEIYEHIIRDDMKWIISTNLEEKENKNKIDLFILENYILEDNMTVKIQDFYGLRDDEIFLYKKIK